MRAKLSGYVCALMVGLGSSVVLAGSGHAQESGLMVHDAWVRLVPPVAKNSAVYMEIMNAGGATAKIESASSPVAAVVEVHQTTMADGVMKMSEVKGLEVPAAGSVTMKPGGYHVMLINLKAPLQKGQEVPVTLNFSTGERLTVKAPVKAMQGKPMSHHHHH